MFDLPGLDMISPFLGAASPAAGALDLGMGAGGAIADAAGSAWDFASGALSNVGSLDPSLIGGPFMPSFGGGGGAAAASGEVEQIPLGLMDIPMMEDATADYQQDWIY